MQCNKQETNKTCENYEEQHVFYISVTKHFKLILLFKNTKRKHK